MVTIAERGQMGSRRSVVVVVVVLLGLGVAGYALTTRTLAAGTGNNGDWRVTADWKPWQTCIRATERNAESGACGLATAGDLTETSPFLVNDEGQDLTVVAGVVPPGAAHVEVIPAQNDPVEARLVRAGLSRFFVAEIPGRQSISDLIARSEGGEVIARLEHGPMPPPGDPTG